MKLWFEEFNVNAISASEMSAAFAAVFRRSFAILRQGGGEQTVWPIISKL
jgi:hypothetical protein